MTTIKGETPMDKVLFVASECTPFVKTGGLADVIGSLPQALKKNEQLDVRVILPLYYEVSEEWRDQMEHYKTFSVTFGWRTQEVSIHKLIHHNIPYYFMENEYYFDREGIYGYYDDGERFVFFSHAVIAALEYLDFEPQVLHAHDWQAGLAVALAKITKPIKHLKTVFTIHNLKYQGLIQLADFGNLFNLSVEHIGGLEWQGMLNCLKSALHHADKITTVSPTYAEEIKIPYYGEGLDSILNERSADLLGVLNGIDVKEYNPLTDPFIAVKYRSARSKKQDNKVILQERFNLPVDREKPLYTIITRLVEQKGLHLLQHVLDEFLQEDVQCIILGTGDYEFEKYFVEVSQRYPDKLVTLLTFDEGLARQLYAGADFFLMPSKFEPCGLSQLISLQYKTVPIVRETGGLKDTVQSFNEFTGEGNGFSFANYNAHDFLAVLRLSLETYYNAKQWSELIRNVNKSQFSWGDSARAYANIYEELLTTTE